MPWIEMLGDSRDSTIAELVDNAAPEVATT
jgi:hypothetical protein